MLDTMYDAMGVGLAAPQVGILKADRCSSMSGEGPIVLINPGIVEIRRDPDRRRGMLKPSGEIRDW